MKSAKAPGRSISRAFLYGNLPVYLLVQGYKGLGPRNPLNLLNIFIEDVHEVFIVFAQYLYKY